MKKKRLLIATHNADKAREMMHGLALLQAKGTEFITLRDLHVKKQPQETGTTFYENARVKSQFYSRLTGLPTIADDGGLIIDALNGEPGVYSKRGMGKESTDKELVDYALLRMRGVPEVKRQARFSTCVWFIDPQSGQEAHAQASIEGTIATEELRVDTHGFPYRVLFIVSQFNKYYLQLTAQEHARINHRLRALKELEQVVLNVLY